MPHVRVLLQRLHDGDHVVLGNAEQHLQVVSTSGDSTWRGAVRISRPDDHWIIEGDGGPLSGRAAESMSLELFGDGVLPGAKGEPDRRYPGQFRVVVTDGVEGWSLINVVTMEQYLPGVLQAELFAGWPAATFEAQAVAARSFATMQVLQRSHAAWDVTDTPATQAYMGHATNDEAWAAVDATEGQLLLFNDALVPGYFSSCCGGLPAVGVDAVGPHEANAIAPLTGHGSPIQCSDAPVYAWTRTVPAEGVHEALQKWAVETGTSDIGRLQGVEQIESAAHNPHGRATMLRITDRGGNEVVVTCGNLVTALASLPQGPLMSGWCTGVRQGDDIVFEGRGYGHGVGLCQYGAARMGRRGRSTRQIIDFYYPGAVIEQRWGDRQRD